MAWIDPPYRLPNGEQRWRVHERRENGTMVSTTCKTAQDAKRQQRAYEAQKDGGALMVPSRALVSEMFAEWLKDRRPHVVAKTYDEYERSVRVRIDPMLGHLKLAKLGAPGSRPTSTRYASGAAATAWCRFTTK
jgi:hypothetical protein